MRTYYLPTASLWNEFMAYIVDAGSRRVNNIQVDILNCHHIRVEASKFDSGYTHTVLRPHEVTTCIRVDSDYLAQLEFLSGDSEVLLTWLTQN